MNRRKEKNIKFSATKSLWIVLFFHWWKIDFSLDVRRTFPRNVQSAEKTIFYPRKWIIKTNEEKRTEKREIESENARKFFEATDEFRMRTKKKNARDNTRNCDEPSEVREAKTEERK